MAKENNNTTRIMKKADSENESKKPESPETDANAPKNTDSNKVIKNDSQVISEDFIPYEDIDKDILEKPPKPPTMQEILYPEIEFFNADDTSLLVLDDLMKKDSKNRSANEQDSEPKKDNTETTRFQSREEIYKSLLNPDVETIMIIGDDKQGVDADENPTTDEGWQAYAQMWLSQQNPVVRSSKKSNKKRKAPSLGSQQSQKDSDDEDDINSDISENSEIVDAKHSAPDNELVNVNDEITADAYYNMPDDFVQPLDFTAINEVVVYEEDDVALFDRPKSQILKKLSESDISCHSLKSEDAQSTENEDVFAEVESSDKSVGSASETSVQSEDKNAKNKGSGRDKVIPISNSPAPMPAVREKQVKNPNLKNSPAPLPETETKKPDKKNQNDKKCFGIAPPPTDDE